MENTTTNIQSAKVESEDHKLIDQYADAGIRLVLLDSSKKGYQKDWANRNPTPEDVKENLTRGGNVGFVAFGGICGVDLDSELVRSLAPHFLRPTLKSGYKGHNPSRYVYYSDGAEYLQIRDMDGEILALKALKKGGGGPGHQFVVPPSVHPARGRYEWNGEFDVERITRISADALDRDVRLLAVTALIADYIPNSSRHHFSLALAGYLLHNGEDKDDVTMILKRAWEVRGFLEYPVDVGGGDGLAKNVRDTANKHKKNEPYTGGRVLKEFNEKLPGLIAKALGWSIADMGGRRTYPLTDGGNAERLVDGYGDRIRYVVPWKSWMVYDGRQWKPDPGRHQLTGMAEATARGIHRDAAREPDTTVQKRLNRQAITSQNKNRIDAMISLSERHVMIDREGLAAHPFDSDPMLINVLNGTIDLRTGDLREHRPSDMITKMAQIEYDPNATAPGFMTFLEQVLPSEEMRGFVRRFAGYSMTGSTEERCVGILWGGGKNGKSTLIELLRDVLGGYAKNTDIGTILQKKYESAANNDVAALVGSRFVSAAEVEKGSRLAEAKIKNLTGGDMITARFLHQEFFDFRPQFKLWLSTNNKPEIQGTDDAIWDRIRLIPFTQRFEGKDADPKLPQKLRKELPGVLAWMVRGCLEWQDQGLSEPKEVREATQDYRAEQDKVLQFIEERCTVGEDLKVKASLMYEAWVDWCSHNYEYPGRQADFRILMQAHGFEHKKTKQANMWLGIGRGVEAGSVFDGMRGGKGGS